MMPRIYPDATRVHTPDIPGVADFVKPPSGVTVHYTASGTASSALNEERKGLGYHIIIDHDGAIIQTCYFSKRVNHAGVAVWNKVSPNSHHIAVAIVSWGKLSTDRKNFLGSTIPQALCRSAYGQLWHMATKEQEAALLKLLNWFLANGIERKNICGHDECALPPGRKADPGGVLSFTMRDFRNESNLV